MNECIGHVIGKPHSPITGLYLGKTAVTVLLLEHTGLGEHLVCDYSHLKWHASSLGTFRENDSGSYRNGVCV